MSLQTTRKADEKTKTIFRLQEHEEITRDMELINFDLSKGDGCTKMLVLIMTRTFISLQEAVSLNIINQDVQGQL